MNRLILGSASPRRTALLSEWGIDHEVFVASVDEQFPCGLDPAQKAIELAHQKALAVRGRIFEERRVVSPGAWILGADTIVFLGDEPLGKPVDDDDARSILARLSGHSVDVITGVVLCSLRDEREFVGSETSTCVMRAFDSEEIDRYVKTGEPRDKAGAFAIQGLGGALIAELKGSRSNVVGLPRSVVETLLSRAGI